MRPQETEFPPHFLRYIDLVQESDAMPALEAQPAILRRFLAGVSAAQEMSAYAPGKWTVRQVAGHLADCERVFGYRALRFGRRDPTPLPGFDENQYVDHAHFNDVPLQALVEEWVFQRSANVRMLGMLRPDEWSLSGIANTSSITVRALAFVMVGHVRHHVNLFRERYGISVA